MNSATKTWLIIASILVITGIIIFSVAMSLNKWNLGNLNTNKYVTNTYEINDDFSDITLETDTADIIVIPSDDNNCKVVCYEPETARHSVYVKDDLLTIKVNDQRKWYNYIGIAWTAPKITIYLPKTEYNSLFLKTDTGKVEIPQDFKFENADIEVTTGNVIFHASASDDIKIQSSTGSISVENITANTMELTSTTGNITINSVECGNDIKLKVSTGKTKVKNVSCNNFSSDGSTGHLSLEDLIATGKIYIKRSTGSASLEKCDASEIYVKTSTGNISGSLLSEKIFITETSTGNISVPKTTTGGKCELITTTGSIKITLD